MQITLTLNGVRVSEEIAPDMLLIDFVRAHGCKSVKRGCETSSCGFCNPGFIMNALALFREQPYPTEEQVKEYLAGNLCRCSGYEGQLRGIMSFLAWKKQKEGVQ